MKLSIFWMLLEAAGAFHAPASPRKNRRLAHQASQVRGVARPARLYDENSENANFLETLALFRRIGAAATLDALLEGLKTRSVDFGRRDDIQWDHEEYRSTLCGNQTQLRKHVASMACGTRNLVSTQVLRTA